MAWGRGDETVWVALGRYGVREVIAKRTPHTAEIVGITRRLIRYYRFSPGAVAIDAGGGGKQIADTLDDRYGLEVTPVEFGGKPDRPAEYRNRCAEIYGELRKPLEPTPRLEQMLATPPTQWTPKQRCLSLPPDDGQLRTELCVLPKSYDGAGRLYLPPKTRLRTARGERSESTVRELLGGRSPDRADALALAWHAWQSQREARALMTVNRPLVL